MFSANYLAKGPKLGSPHLFMFNMVKSGHIGRASIYTYAIVTIGFG